MLYIPTLLVALEAVCRVRPEPFEAVVKEFDVAGVIQRCEAEGDQSIAILSYDEKPGMQAIGTTAPDLPPVPKEITLSEAVTVKELAEKLHADGFNLRPQVGARPASILMTLDGTINPG